MPEPKSDTLVKLVETLVTEKRAVVEKEKELIEGLNRALAQIGYEVVPKEAAGAGPRSRRRRRRRRGRPRGGIAGRPAEGGGPRRRGRPPKAA